MDESRVRYLAESERIGLVVADLSGNLLEVNDAFLRLAGYGREELDSRHLGWRDLTPPEYWSRDEQAIDEIRRTGACSPYEKELVHPDGRRVPVLLAGSLADAQAGTCVDIVVDLSGRRRVESALQESRERLQAALDAARSAAAENARLLERERAARVRAEAAESRAAFLAEAGEVLASSLEHRATLRALARLAVPRIADYCVLLEVGPSGEVTQVAAEHIDPHKETLLARVGELHRDSRDSRDRGDAPRSLIAAVLGTDRPEIVAYPTLLEWDGKWESEVPQDPELREIFGQLHPVSGMLLPIEVRGRILGILGLVQSESGRRFDDADLELGVELARRAALAIDHTYLYEEARAASAAKDRFLATLSHELRTPLTPVLAVVSTLEQETGLTGKGREALAMIRRNIELEARLIDDLLDVTRAVHGKLALARDLCDLRSIVEHAFDTCAPDALAERWVAVDLTAGEHWVIGDDRRLTQVFANLLQNAVKFTPAGGSIALRSRHEEDGAGSWLVVAVEDTGLGIEPDLLPRIFEAFEQGPLESRAGGLGLGLAISKALVELHGGRLTAASAGRGHGATFTVCLPLAAALWTAGQVPVAAAPAIAHPSPAPRARPLRILLVEDHEDTALALTDLLSLGGHQVTTRGTVADGKAAAGEVYARGESFDLLLSDLGLPDGTGLDLMRDLGPRYGLRGIALSGFGMEEDLLASREAGFARHLVKPVGLATLQEAIRQVTAAAAGREGGG
jgi:two-component system CheB/CheR fusion protein